MSKMKVTRFKFKDGAFAGGEKQSLTFGVGMEFKRTFNAADQPFLAAKKYADATLRSNEHFERIEDLVLSVENSAAFSKNELVQLALDQKIEEPGKLNKLPLIKKILGIAEETAVPVGNPEAGQPKESEDDVVITSTDPNQQTDDETKEEENPS